MACEMVLLVNDLMRSCAKRRAEMMSHAARIAIVMRMMLRVSAVVTKRSVRKLHSLSKSSASLAIIHEMMAVGAVSKLCLVLQVDCGIKTKEKVQEILSSNTTAANSRQPSFCSNNNQYGRAMALGGGRPAQEQQGFRGGFSNGVRRLQVGLRGFSGDKGGSGRALASGNLVALAMASAGLLAGRSLSQHDLGHGGGIESYGGFL
ncbi:hypothetical protein J5N97_019958 [Dioscorea zingiberensis]|uniref:U-box domain-containing protein n=1 Tax=Dioscorea zingiberensis TaxID=325984 RepID=A0A9D5CFN6_9LILI|nr:hypothetical protein J5N97_019958 [Dioscorea zingiberensis]